MHRHEQPPPPLPYLPPPLFTPRTHMATPNRYFERPHLKNRQQAQITEADRRLAVLRQSSSRGRNVDLFHQLVEDLEPDHIVVIRRLGVVSFRFIAGYDWIYHEKQNVRG